MEPATILALLAFSFILFSVGIIVGQHIEEKRTSKKIKELEAQHKKEKTRSDMLMSVCDLIK